VEDRIDEPSPGEAAAGSRSDQLGQLVAKVKAHCDQHGISCAIQETVLGPGIEIDLPAGRGVRRARFAGIERLQQLLDIPFEKYVALGDFAAIASYDEGTIEALVESSGQLPARAVLIRRLERDSKSSAPLLSLSREKVQLALGNASKALLALEPGPARGLAQGPGPLALHISGLAIDQYDEAIERLEAIANGLFLELDIAYEVPLVLRRRRQLRFIRRRKPAKADELMFPVSEYDPQAMALYWYGRGAAGMPLLRFLAFYQVLEFYFPIYADQEVRRRVKGVVKDPSFKPHNELHISKIMKAMDGGGRRGFGDEKSQLRATIRGCANPDDLRDFLNARDGRAEYFEERKKRDSPASTVIRSAMNDEDLIDAAAGRIYEIRCRVVHTKDSGGDRGQLLPFSVEAEGMDHDIELLETLARGALVAGSRELTL
jgi:hypothetical protein